MQSRGKVHFVSPGMLRFMQSSLHVDSCEGLLPEHPMPAALRVCGKLAVLDGLLIKLLAAGHKVRMDSLCLTAYHIASLSEHLYLVLTQYCAPKQLTWHLSPVLWHTKIRLCCWTLLQVLVFSTMTRLLDILEDHLAWRGIDSLRLDGSTASASRGALVRPSSGVCLTHFVARATPKLEHCCKSSSARYAFLRAVQKAWRSHKHAPASHSH